MRVPAFLQNRRWRLLLLGVAIAAMAVVPWLHNHTYLRDLYDYGLVMAANGRLLAGERPYVDFTTPIQAGTFLPNLAAEVLGGGTYVGMTLGAALATAATALGLLFLFSRRWPAGISALIAAAIVVGSLSQHTIIWYNATGTICLALVAWGCAAAPVLRARHWRWHCLVAAALILGGMNKINYQLLTLAFAAGWAVRERLAGRAGWSRLALTLGACTACGAVVPVLIELAWTGASFAQWWYNVVTVPFGGRAGSLADSLSWLALVRPQHDYYGKLTLQPVGLLCLVVAAGAGVAIWRRTRGSPGERLSGIGAAGLAAAGALALLATNYEIAYLALAAGVALGAALWLGFGLAPRGKLFWLTLGTPAVLLLLAGGESAWRGQRSQFGHLSTDRKTYRDLSTAGTAYGYFAGLHAPPEVVDSLVALEPKLPPARPDGRRVLIWGSGVEFLDRAFPSVKYPGLPLWMAYGTSIGPSETRRLVSLIRTDSTLERIYVANPWAYLHPVIGEPMGHFFGFRELSRFIGCWSRFIDISIRDDAASGTPFTEAVGVWDGINLWNMLASPVDPCRLTFRGDAGYIPRSENHAPLLGIGKGSGSIHLASGARSIECHAELRRTAPCDRPIEAVFVVHSFGSKDTLWSAHLALAPGETGQSALLSIGTGGEPLEFVVSLDDSGAGSAVAGYRRLAVVDTASDNEPPPRLRTAAPPDAVLSSDEARKWFPPGDWKIASAVARGVVQTPDGLLFEPGSELWFKPDKPLGQVVGQLRLVPHSQKPAPVIRFLWHKGVRMEMFRQEQLSSPDASIDFHGWSPEADGWFGIMIDPGASAPALIRFTAAD